MKLPGLICVQKCDYEPRVIKINGYIKAQDSEVAQYNSEDIKLDPSEAGIKGSPTYVSKAFRPEQKKVCEMFYP